jgi:hypothetical protein
VPHWLTLPFSLIQFAWVSRLEMLLMIFFTMPPIGWLMGFAAADSTANAKLLISKALIVSAIKALVLFILSPFDELALVVDKIKAYLKPFFVYRLGDGSFLFIRVHLFAVSKINLNGSLFIIKGIF